MRAALTTHYGPPGVVHVTDVPRPMPQADELLVRVHATTVNRTDCGFRAGHPWFIRVFTGVTKPKSTILGSEFAGVVETVGEDVSRFVVGDRVFAYDDTRFGGHAEYVAISQSAAVATMPGLLFSPASTLSGCQPLTVMKASGLPRTSIS